MNNKMIFLGQDELELIRRMRKDGELDRAEQTLLKGEPSAAVLDELRLIASKRAHLAKNVDDWDSVIEYLEGYSDYARKNRLYCIKMVNQEPPQHTNRDKRLLSQAKEKVQSS